MTAAEVLEANEQAIAVLVTALGDVIGRAALSQALMQRVIDAQAAKANPARDRILATAVQILRNPG